MMMKHRMSLRDVVKVLSPMAFLTAIVWGCANPGTPTGGPRDRKPPVVLSSTPPPGATDFNGKTVKILFDENVQLKDADKKFVMSPPAGKNPKVTAHGKEITVAFEDELQPATTYTLDFADCLSDLNESNVCEGFTFSFSTGESSDSMMISGNVFDAMTTMPIEGIYVLLHSDTTDTTFTHVMPRRVAKTDADGRFAIKNVPAGSYYSLYVLDDQNRNFLFDQPGEKVAWLEERVMPAWEMRHVPDSVRTDSTYMEGDSVRYVYKPVVRDTLVYTPDSLSLFAFDEDVYDQYIKLDERKARNTMRFVFNKPMSRRPRISFPNQAPAGQVAKIQYSPTNDSVMVWMTDTTIWKKDSIMVAINYLVLDTLGEMVEKTDTLTEWHFERKEEQKKIVRRRKKTEEAKPKVEVLKVNVAGGVAPYADLPITSPTPFDTFRWEAVRLYHKVDTIFEPVKYTAVNDTVDLCRKAIKYKWVAGDSYKVEIDSAAVRDIYGLLCDDISKPVNISSNDKFGTLYVDVDSVPDNGLLQLVNTQGAVLRQNYLKASGKAGFRYLRPGDYMLRILIDDNRNGTWDTGNYAERRQPEQFIYYMEKVTVRANWDVHVDFNTKLFTADKYAKKFGKKKSKKRTR